MKMTVNISGIGTSAARMRALVLVREAIAKREADACGERRPDFVDHTDDLKQQMRGK